MGLAAQHESDRGAERRAVEVAGTMRTVDGVPCDLEILDISSSGFLAELPEGRTLDPGARVRVANAAIGRQTAVLVRREDRRHGFVFTRPLPADAIDAIDPRHSNVAPLFATIVADPVPPEPRKLSPRMSLLLIAGMAGGLWTAFGSLLYLTA